MANTEDTVREVLIDTLELSQTPAELTRETALFGSLPELDSLGDI